MQLSRKFATMTGSDSMRTSNRKDDIRIRLRVPVFFLLLVASLGLSDAPQNAADLYWPLMTVITVPLWEAVSGIAVGRTLTALTLLAAAASAVSTLLSWSPAVSITSLMRIVVGLLWLRRFCMIGPRERDRIPVYFGAVMSILAASALVTYVIPASRAAMPPFSLLSSPSGHLTSVYFALPILIFLMLIPERRTIFYRTAGTLLSAILVLVSFSRAAILAGAVFFGVMAGRKDWKPATKILSVSACLLLFSTAVFLIWIPTMPPDFRTRIPVPAALSAYVSKDTLTDNPRIAFIRESVAGFAASPMWGTGPGTFGLVSQRYAKSQYAITAYVHTALIGLLAETGLAGTTITAVLIVYATVLVYASRKKWHRDTPAFAAMLGAMLFLSMVHPVFSHYPVLLITIACIGCILGPAGIRHRSPAPLVAVMVALLVLYSASWIGSAALLSRNLTALAFYAAPYRRDVALTALRAPGPLPRSLRAHILALYPKDSGMLMALAGTEPDDAIKNRLMERAISAYPTDTAIQTRYLTHITATQSPARVCDAIRSLSDSPEIPCDDAAFAALVRTDTFRSLLQLWNGPWGNAKFLYEAGLSLERTGTDPSNVARLWAAARDLAPQWGYFHIELAAQIARINGTQQAAVPVLLSCLSHPEPAAQCNGYLTDLARLPAPGYWEPEILAIPDVLHNRK